MMKSKQIIERIRQDFPDFCIASKQDSRFWKILGKINTKWLSDFSTTIGKTIWVSSKFEKLSELEKCAILVHEAIHLYDIRFDGRIYFYIKYCSPQILSAFAILGFLEPLFFFCLIFLLPQISLGRAEYEFRAYAAGFFVYRFEGFFKRNPHLKEKVVSWVNSQFTGSSYYWMFSDIKSHFNRMIEVYETQYTFESDFYDNGELFREDQLSFMKDIKRIMEK